MGTYLITGGAGFIGSTLAEKLLKDENKVVIIDNFSDFYDVSLKERNLSSMLSNSNLKFYRGDIRDAELVSKIFAENDIDAVVHLAAMAGVRPSIENPILYQDINCIGTQNILEAMREYKISKGVFASSSSVYGNCDTVPFNEEMQVDFSISPYAATKKANEVMAHVYHKLFNMNIIMLRFFTVFGPKQRPDLAINKFTRLMIENKPIEMYGDGSSSRDYTYVDDIVDGIIKSLNYVATKDKVYEIINLGNSSPITLKELIDIIASELKVVPEIIVKEQQPGDVDRTYADISKAVNLLGYDPKTSTEQGISNFIKWYKAFNCNK